MLIKYNQGDPKPVERTITANIGDRVDLEVTTSESDTFYWQKNGGDDNLWPDQNKVTFNQVDVSDAGFYECHFTGHRADGTQAMLRLIVRGNG